MLWDILKSGIGLHGEPFTFHEDGLCTTHNSDFCKDSRFLQAYNEGRKTNSWKEWSLRWRAYLYCCFAEQSFGLVGDFVECGVNLGGNARMLIEYLPFGGNKKRFFLYDTFEGFDPSLLFKKERRSIYKYYKYPSSFAAVEKTFQKYPFVRLVKGSVPSSLEILAPKKVCFLSIDMNCVKPEIAAFEFFWPKLTAGAVVLLDDYGFRRHLNQKVAFDALSRRLHFNITQLPTGQGLIKKPLNS